MNQSIRTETQPGAPDRRPRRGVRAIRETLRAKAEMTIDFYSDTDCSGAKSISLALTDIARFVAHEFHPAIAKHAARGQHACEAIGRNPSAPNPDYDIRCFADNRADASPHVGDEPPVVCLKRIPVIARQASRRWCSGPPRNQSRSH